MKWFIAFLFLTLSQQAFSKLYIHCDAQEIKDGQTVGSKELFCSEAKVYQHDQKYGEIKVGQNMSLIVKAELPKFNWKLISYNELMVEQEMNLKLGNHFTINTEYVRFHCLANKNKCNSSNNKAMGTIERALFTTPVAQ